MKTVLLIYFVWALTGVVLGPVVLLLLLAATFVFLLIYLNISLTRWPTGAFELPDFMPEHFVQLNAKQRKTAIDLVWDEKVVTVMELIRNSDFMNLCIHAGKALALLLYGSIMAGVLGMSLYYADVGLSSNFEDLVPMVVVLSLMAAAGASSMLYLSRSLEQRLAKAQEEDEQRRIMATLFRKVAVSQIANCAPIWFEEVRRMALLKASDLLDISATQSFDVFSTDPATIGSQFIPPVVSLTLFFSNGHLSVVSDVNLDIKNSSYSLIENNQGAPSINDVSLWTYEEFHYRDVVQIGFSVQGIEKLGFQNVDGVLQIILSSGTQKVYPAYRQSITNLQTVVRDRVRANKSVAAFVSKESQVLQSHPDTADVRASFCPKCGNSLAENDMFCRNCGVRISR